MPLRIVHTCAISPAETFGVTAGTTFGGGGATGQFATGPGRGAGWVTAPGRGAGATDPGGRGAGAVDPIGAATGCQIVPAGPPFGVPGQAPGCGGVTAPQRSAHGVVSTDGGIGPGVSPGVVSGVGFCDFGSAITPHAMESRILSSVVRVELLTTSNCSARLPLILEPSFTDSVFLPLVTTQRSIPYDGVLRHSPKARR